MSELHAIQNGLLRRINALFFVLMVLIVAKM